MHVKDWDEEVNQVCFQPGPRRIGPAHCLAKVIMFQSRTSACIHSRITPINMWEEGYITFDLRLSKQGMSILCFLWWLKVVWRPMNSNGARLVGENAFVQKYVLSSFIVLEIKYVTLHYVCEIGNVL
ncbi:unnamed protein product [Malus baccata var. baccata]